MPSRNAVVVCCRPCHLTPRLVARPAAVPPGGARFPLTLRPSPPLRPLRPFRCRLPPALLKRKNAPLARLLLQTVKMYTEAMVLSPWWSLNLSCLFKRMKEKERMIYSSSSAMECSVNNRRIKTCLGANGLCHYIFLISTVFCFVLFFTVVQINNFFL